MKIAGLLLEMYDESLWTKEKIIHHFKKEVFDEAVSKEYIMGTENCSGECVYKITNAGKSAFDKNEY